MPTEYFETRERALLGPRYEELYAAPTDNAARGVTVSALRAQPDEFAARAGLALKPSPFCTAAFAVDEETFRPGRHPYHHAGVFYSQEPSAASAAPLLGVKPGMRVLDLCAAPGGKSSQLAAALRGQGLLVSNEYVAARAEILKSNLERMGVANAVVLNETPARIAAALPEFFDRVLVDAPCSGEGMFRKEPAALAQHSEALVRQCAALGAEILDCAAAVLAPGGELVYSTCTFAPEEDEAQVGAFLARHPEFALVDALGNVDYTFGSEGEANRTGGYALDVRKVRRIWPCQGGEGHFMARLVKAGTPRVLPQAGTYSAEEELWLAQAAKTQQSQKGKNGANAGKAQGSARAERREASRACREAARGGRGGKGAPTAPEARSASPAQVLAAWQEFAARSFPALLDRPAVVRGDSVLLPVPFPPVALHILRAGVFAGSVQKGRFVPEHHLFTAFGAQCANCEPLALDDARTEEYLAGREIEARAAQDGWCCVTVDGWPLGGGKVSAGRVKNHYPKALRNL
jgi:16S rRNA C967 or C1407 C5-methylase (RsmB/RsmF family)/NOL1/NOP2/fmu family ribosome biogenesis protein